LLAWHRGTPVHLRSVLVR